MDARYSGIIRRSENGLRGNHRAVLNKSKIKAAKLMICLGILVVSFLLKILFPGLSSDIKREILPVLESSVDYKAAFYSMGRFFAGKARFTEAFGDMVAFLVTGEKAVKAGTGEAADLAEPKETELHINKEALDKLSALYHNAEGLLTQDGGVLAEPGIPGDFAQEISEENIEEDTSVADFLKAQDAFTELELPDNVNIHKLILPFVYEYIYAFADGKVLVSGDSESLGLYLILSHPEGFVTQYFHCDELTVHGGDPVTNGQKIAEVGDKGNTTGPHLHFELLSNGLYLNPEYYLHNGN